MDLNHEAALGIKTCRIHPKAVGEMNIKLTFFSFNLSQFCDLWGLICWFHAWGWHFRVSSPGLKHALFKATAGVVELLYKTEC